jgi:hypothetical protein
MTDWDSPWDEAIIFRKREIPMELPEDIYFYFVSRYAIVQDLIDRFDLDLET